MTTARGIIDDLLSSAGALEIRLMPLTPVGTAQLLADALGRAPDDPFARASHDVTGGNPFLVTELARSLRARGVTPVAGATADLEELVPRSVVRRVRAQLRRLSPEAEALARAAAVFGAEAELRHAGVLAGLAPADAAAAADALHSAALVAGVHPLVFKHAVVRAAILADVPPARLALDHGRAAQLLMSDDAPAERIAAHLLRTAPSQSAAVTAVLVRAGDAALHHGSPSSSIAYLERALVEHAPDPPRWELLHRLGCAAALAGRPDAVAHLRAAHESAPEEARPRTALALGDVLGRSGSGRDAHDILRTALSVLADRHDDSTRALRALLESVLLTHSQVDLSLMPGARLRVESLLDLPGDLSEERALLAVVSYIKANDGSDASLALAIADRALPRGASSELPPRPPWTEAPVEWLPYGLLSRALATLGDIDRARRIQDWIFDDATKRGSLETHLLGLVAQAALSYTVGDVTGAAADVATAVERSLESGSAAALPLAAGMVAATAIERGDHGPALALLENLGLLGPLPELGILDAPLYFRGLLRAEHGDVEAGLADLLELGRREQRTGQRALFTPWRVGAATVLARAGRGEEARPLVEEELASARRRGVPWLLGAALRVEGAVDGGAAGLAALEEAVAVLDPSPFRLEAARAQVDLGAALRRANRRGEARARLEAGVELATRCGATALAERGAAELAATGARPRRVFISGPESLTPSERRVAELAATGRSNPEIAQALFVTRKTVETHLGRVYQKLHIGRREEIARALRG